jgi:tetratricopeptide (TPR) repeat protein
LRARRSDFPCMRHILFLTAGVLVLALPTRAQRTLAESDRELLEQRIEALERTLDREHAIAQELRGEHQREATKDVERLEGEIETRTQILGWTFTIALTVLAFFGWRTVRRWIRSAVRKQVIVEVSAQLSGDRIKALVREQASPHVEASMNKVKTEAEEALADLKSRLKEMYERQVQEYADRQAEGSGGPVDKGKLNDLTELQDAIKPDPATWTALDWMVRAGQAAAVGNYAAALTALDNAIAFDPSQAVAHNNRGNVLFELGRYEEALASIDKAIALEPSQAIAHSNRGNTLNELGRHKEALIALDHALALGPENAVAHGIRGHALNGLGRYEEALIALDRAVALDPADDVSQTNRGRTLIELGRYQEAVAAFERADDLDPDHPATRSHRAWLYIKTGEPDLAVAYADKALSLAEAQPDRDFRRAAALYYKAVALRMLGQDSTETDQALAEVLTVPFTRRLSPYVLDPAVSEDPEVQAYINDLSEQLRAHDAARPA